MPPTPNLPWDWGSEHRVVSVLLIWLFHDVMFSCTWSEWWYYLQWFRSMVYARNWWLWMDSPLHFKLKILGGFDDDFTDGCSYWQLWKAPTLASISSPVAFRTPISFTDNSLIGERAGIISPILQMHNLGLGESFCDLPQWPQFVSSDGV